MLGHVKNMSICHISQLQRRHRAARRLKGDGIFPVRGAIFLRRLLLWTQNSRVLTVPDIFGICSFQGYHSSLVLLTVKHL